MTDKHAIQSYKDLKVLQEAMNLAEECYHLTKLFQSAEIYGMTSQIRRSAVSVPNKWMSPDGKTMLMVSSGSFDDYYLTLQKVTLTLAE